MHEKTTSFIPNKETIILQWLEC